jgi:hypothetical protein
MWYAAFMYDIIINTRDHDAIRYFYYELHPTQRTMDLLGGTPEFGMYLKLKVYVSLMKIVSISNRMLSVSVDKTTPCRISLRGVG